MTFNGLTYLLALLLALAPVGGGRAAAPVAQIEDAAATADGSSAVTSLPGGSTSPSVESAHVTQDLPATLQTVRGQAPRPPRVSQPAGSAPITDRLPGTFCSAEAPIPRLRGVLPGRPLFYLFMSLQR
jgi:hypothetical protein